MKKTMNYNEVYHALMLLNDLSQLKLAAKATTEKLLIRAHYAKPMKDFEEFSQSVNGDEKADDEAKKSALETKASETIEGFTPRSLSVEAFEQIVEAAADRDMITSGIAAPVKNDKGEVTGAGQLPTEFWLQTIAENLVEV